jgi:hypothetical protein
VYFYQNFKTNKYRKITGWTITLLLSLVFLFSGGVKIFTSSEEMSKMAGSAGNVLLLGLIEVCMVAMLLIPRTALVGILLMIAYTGGVMAVHLTGGLPILIPVILQCLIWITGALRFPELTDRLIAKGS